MLTLGGLMGAKSVDSNPDDFANDAYFGLDICIDIVLNPLLALQER